MKVMKQRLRLGVLALGLPALQACYQYVPLTTNPPVGEIIEFQITDQGRVGLADRFGPGIARFEGRVASTEGSEYVINVFSVAQLDGSSSLWSGESVRLPQAYVGSMQGRELSKSRTALVAAGAAGGVIAFALTRGLFGGYSGPTDSTGGPGPQKVRIPIRLPIRP